MMAFRILLVLIVAVIAVQAFVPTLQTRIHRSSQIAMSLKEGDHVPAVTFKARVRDDNLPQPNPFKWKDVTTDDLFKGKRVVIFALPGGLFISPFKIENLIFVLSFYPNLFFHPSSRV